ncbi:hypothetical protein Tco_1518876, partial [Tanacetum coccineum]
RVLAVGTAGDSRGVGLGSGQPGVFVGCGFTTVRDVPGHRVVSFGFVTQGNGCVVCDFWGCYTLPVQNINQSAFKSMFEKEKLSGNNFNEWFARLKLVLRVEKKMHVIEQPLPPAPEPVAEPNVVDQWTSLYDAHTEIACLMLGSMTPELHRQFELYYLFDMIQELKSMFKKQAISS